MYIIIMLEPDADSFVVMTSLEKATERYEREVKKLNSAFFTKGVILAEVEDGVDFGFSTSTPTSAGASYLYGCKEIKSVFKEEN